MLSDAIKTGRSFSKGSRAQNIIYSGTLAMIAAYSQHGSTARGLACYLLIMLLYAVATNFNNISDLQTDILNKRNDNPFITSALKRYELTLFICVCLLCIVALQFSMRQPGTAIVTASYLVLSYIYSDSFFRLKSRGLLGTALLCICYGTLPLLFGFLQGALVQPHLMIELALFMPLSIAPLILAKDYKDYKGDRLTHKKTPLVLLGSKRLFLLASSLALVSVIAYAIFVVTHHVNLLIGFAIAASYFVLTRQLHTGKGHMTRLYKTALFLSLLAMPVSTLYG
ncbi:MAG TPA: UbiA family prenyltransferase [Candidatus Saccharimonadales bacterium]|jgi:4-hydroxybenzoate polyprenyltransferase|nr:UbiA family prenyltransferase [Candidatus Saccharimonadales bacterium]